MEKIKECPFCKSDKDVTVYSKGAYELISDRKQDEYGGVIECRNCGVMMFTYVDKVLPYETMVDMLIKKWNYRGWDEP